MLPFEKPLNSEEKYFFAIGERLDVIIELLNKFIEIQSKPESKKTTKKK